MTKTESAETPAPSPRKTAIKLYLILLTCFLTIYAFTAQRGQAWQDSGIYQLRIMDGDLVGQYGLALSHPLMILLGGVLAKIPIGTLAWRINLVSAIPAAFAVANIGLLTWQIVQRRVIVAIIAACTFGLAHATWWLATICESQSLHVAFFTGIANIIVLIVNASPTQRRNLPYATFGLICGMAVATHGLALLAIPAMLALAIYLMAKRQLRISEFINLLVGWMIGAGIFMFLIYHLAASAGIVAAIKSALFGDSWSGAVMNTGGKPWLMGLKSMAISLPNLCIPLAIIGAISLRKYATRSLTITLLYFAAVYLLFAIRYDVRDQFMFFLPFYAMACMLSGVGLDVAMDRLSARSRKTLLAAAIVGAFMSPIVCAAATMAWKPLNLPSPGRSDLPFRNPERYWFCPWKFDENSAGQFAAAVAMDAEANSCVIADPTALPPLIWEQKWRDNSPGKFQAAELRDANTVFDMEMLYKATTGAKIYVTSAARHYYPIWIDELAKLEKPATKSVLFEVKFNLPDVTETQPASQPTSQMMDARQK